MDDLITDRPVLEEEEERLQQQQQQRMAAGGAGGGSGTRSTTSTSATSANISINGSTARLRSSGGSVGTSGTATTTTTGADGRPVLHPPSFSDSVKRSTRFITAVPAAEVLSKVEAILNGVKCDKAPTPIGLISRVELNWELYRLDVWASHQDPHGPPVCSLQLYQLPSSCSSNSNGNSPDRLATNLFSSSPSTSLSSSFRAMDMMGALVPQQLYLVEFVRGQLEIFAFKRFYQWVRLKLSELVKRDYAINLFEQAASPM
jgi:hypothetical protein